MKVEKIKYTLTDGENLMKIGMGVGVGCYFSYINPICLTWCVGDGSVDQLLALLPRDEKYIHAIGKQINDELNNTSSKNLCGLFEIVKPLMQLFPNGKYEINFLETEDFGAGPESNFPDDLKGKWSFHICDITNYEERCKYTNAIFNETTESSAQASYLFNQYSDGICFIGTQPRSIINQQRVTYYENLISGGARPTVLVFSLKVHDTVHNSLYVSDVFVIDGHHKMIAYEKLGINPVILEITKVENNFAEVEFDLSNIKKYLFPSQIRLIERLIKDC